MFRAQHVAELLYDVPFEPLEIELGSGETSTIHQPGNLIVMHNKCYLFEFRGRAARSCRHIAPAHIARVNRLRDGTARAGRRHAPRENRGGKR